METKEVRQYILGLQRRLNIQIDLNVSYMSNGNLYGSVTVGRFGFMLCDTWQPYSDTTFQFKIESETGDVYDYETKFVNHKLVDGMVKYGHYKTVFNKNIINTIKACIDWSSAKNTVRYKTALKKLQP